MNPTALSGSRGLHKKNAADEGRARENSTKQTSAVTSGAQQNQRSTSMPTRYTTQSSIAIVIITSIVGRRGWFTARHDGRLLYHSRTPLLDGARTLLAAGYPPNTILVMKHAASDVVALSSIVGAAARLTVNDNRLGTPQFRRWRAPGGDVAAPPVRHTRLPRAGHRVDATSLLEASPSPRAAACPERPG